MNFSQRQADPRRHLVGITLVILFHVAVVYALVTGLATKVVDVVRAPVETRIVEEIKRPPPPPPPPPPPEIVRPPPSKPKLQAPPLPFIPPPVVRIATPPVPQPTIIATTPTPPPAPVNITPTPPVPVAPPAPVMATEPPAPPAPPTPPVPRPSVLSIGVACATQIGPIMPRRALREGINGSVRARATIKGGKVIAVEILSSQPKGVFDSAVRNAMLQYGCQTGEDEVAVEQAFNFKLD